MAELRFRFQLTDLAQVAPWGDTEPSLHWFGLTDGHFWIEIDGQELLRYAPRHRGGDRPGHPYVDYYVARFWEDLIQLAPVVMEPVPADLAGFIAGDRGDWRAVDSDEASDAAIWYSAHVLDFSYLRRPPHIRAWRTVDTVTWRHQPGDEVEFVADPVGLVRMPAESFVAAVRRFDGELMAAMRQRIAEVERTGVPAGVALDLDELRREHRDRSAWCERRLADRPRWDGGVVRSGAAQLLGLTADRR